MTKFLSWKYASLKKRKEKMQTAANKRNIL